MSKELPPSRRAEQFVARFPDGLRDQLATVAKSNGRSMNAEITARLRSSFEPADSERIKALELELATAHAATAAADAKAAQYQAALMFVAGRMPAEVFSNTPGIASAVKQAGMNKRAQLVETVKQMIDDNLRTIVDLDKQIAGEGAKPVKGKR